VNTIQFQLGGTLKFVSDESASRSGARMTIRYRGFTLTAWGDGMAYKLPNDHQISVQVAYIDSHGNPAAIDGDVTWDTSDSNIATVETNSGDTTMATIIPNGAVGQVQVTCTADADLGEGIREIITTMDVDIVAGEAVAGTITPVGPPVPIS
jgi:hypothetical protein